MNLQGGGETDLSITTFSMQGTRVTGAAESGIRIEHGRAITLAGRASKATPAPQSSPGRTGATTFRRSSCATRGRSATGRGLSTRATGQRARGGAW